MKVRPKKHLGQHFLTDMSISKRISDSVLPNYSKSTLEIGPGTGVLTQYLLKRDDFELTAIEVDRESIEYLNINYPQLTEKLITGDFLQSNLSEMYPEGVNIVGNFPYNISSQIYFKILEYRDLVPQSVGMIQKEVAVRIAEKPGTKQYGILSVFLQAFYDIEYLFTVEPHVFNPPPKVQSAVIRLIRNSRKALDCDEKLFFRVVKATFNQRRKMIRNSLRAAFPTIEETHDFFTLRPEKLSVEQFEELTRFVTESLKKTQENEQIND